MLEEIRELQRLLLKKKISSYKRYFFKEIEIERLTGIIGARGVGKTTFLLQFLKENPTSVVSQKSSILTIQTSTTHTAQIQTLEQYERCL